MEAPTLAMPQCAQYGHERGMAGTCIWCQVQMPVVQYAPVVPTYSFAITVAFCMWLQENFDRLVAEANAVTKAH